VLLSLREQLYHTEGGVFPARPKRTRSARGLVRPAEGVERRERMIWAIIVLGEYPCIAARGSLFDLS
jgi:hypothetical protein